MENMDDDQIMGGTNDGAEMEAEQMDVSSEDKSNTGNQISSEFSGPDPPGPAVAKEVAVGADAASSGNSGEDPSDVIAVAEASIGADTSRDTAETKGLIVVGSIAAEETGDHVELSADVATKDNQHHHHHSNEANVIDPPEEIAVGASTVTEDTSGVDEVAAAGDQFEVNTTTKDDISDKEIDAAITSSSVPAADASNNEDDTDEQTGQPIVTESPISEPSAAKNLASEVPIDQEISPDIIEDSVTVDTFDAEAVEDIAVQPNSNQPSQESGDGHLSTVLSCELPEVGSMVEIEELSSVSPTTIGLIDDSEIIELSSGNSDDENSSSSNTTTGGKGAQNEDCKTVTLKLNDSESEADDDMIIKTKVKVILTTAVVPPIPSPGTDYTSDSFDLEEAFKPDVISDSSHDSTNAAEREEGPSVSKKLKMGLSGARRDTANVQVRTSTSTGAAKGRRAADLMEKVEYVDLDTDSASSDSTEFGAKNVSPTTSKILMRKALTLQYFQIILFFSYLAGSTSDVATSSSTSNDGA